MDTLQNIAQKHHLLLIEDAAQGLMASYKGQPLGSFGDLGCFSFHETKNIIAGEGGALIINNPQFTEQAEIIREKGTNRSQFFRGQVDKYTWISQGSSYLPGELIAIMFLIVCCVYLCFQSWDFHRLKLLSWLLIVFWRGCKCCQ
jgi:dTDP-4-amino-4,6-dideoxygalactose transaminase